MWLLMQKPKAAAADRPSSSAPAPKAEPKKTGAPPDRRQPKNGKFDKRAKKVKTPMPVQLRGGVPIDSDGKSICYGYNLGTCHDKACKRGRHICCKPGCFSPNHNFLNHDKAS
eukprot:s2689_g3.t1